MDIFEQYMEDWCMNTELVGWLNPADHEAFIAQLGYCMETEDSGTIEYLQITETGEILAIRQIAGHTVESTPICAGGSRTGIDCLRDNLREIEPSSIPDFAFISCHEDGIGKLFDEGISANDQDGCWMATATTRQQQFPQDKPFSYWYDKHHKHLGLTMIDLREYRAQGG